VVRSYKHLSRGGGQKLSNAEISHLHGRETWAGGLENQTVSPEKLFLMWLVSFTIFFLDSVIPFVTTKLFFFKK
jgi:hypothetical protein